jgi:hypothetical protein
MGRADWFRVCTARALVGRLDESRAAVVLLLANGSTTAFG